VLEKKVNGVYSTIDSLLVYIMEGYMKGIYCMKNWKHCAFVRIVAIIALLISGVFFSCPSTDIPTYNFYFKNIYLGEESFLFEGEIWEITDFLDTGHYALIPINISISDSFVVRLKSDNYRFTDWEIYGSIISENKFQMAINSTANEIHINDVITSNNNHGLSNYGFPEDFPVCELEFYFNENKTPYGPQFDDGKIRTYYFTYVFVAEPIDLSGVRISERDKDNYLFHCFYKYHFDLNFTKAGWYLMVERPIDKMSNDLEFTLGKNNMFYFSDY
jgi:hypothetical protein